MIAQRELEELVLNLLPLQGQWADVDYLWLTEHTNQLIEFTDGLVEVLPMPTEKHQSASQVLLLAFINYLRPLGGKVHYAPLRLQIRPGKYREPDLLLLLDARDPRRDNRAWRGADLVVEIVSPDDPDRDLVTKRRDYAEARIPEYWIVNPQDRTITVLVLDGAEYVAHGLFHPGELAASVVLPGFQIEVSAVFAAD